jgi:outer membrane autotransporter protein
MKKRAHRFQASQLHKTQFAFSALTLALTAAFPQTTLAQTVPVPTADSAATLQQAFIQDPAGSTVVLTAQINLVNSGSNVTFFPGPIQGMTIDARAFPIVGLFSWGGSTLNTALVTLLGTYQGTNGTGSASGSSALSVLHQTITNDGSITGGSSASGNGGSGVSLSGGVFVNNGTITGGEALSATGNAGVGLGMAMATNGFVNLTNHGTIQGGNGNGRGGASGVSLGTIGGVVLTNDGTIRGGSDLLGTLAGGSALQIRASINGSNVISNSGMLIGGNDAAAIVSTGAFSLTNSGTIQAGAGHANAIQFTSGTGALTLELDAGSVIVGNVVANAASTSNALLLGGNANDVFDVSSIGAAAQYQNFNSFTKTGASTWALTGTGTTATPWTIQQGTLQIGNGGTSGSIIGDVTDNGTLAFDRSDAFSLDNLVTGTGSVNQVGTGTTIITAANTYSGGTNVLAGTLAVGDAAHTNASIGSGLTTVAAGATLGGYGTVSGAVNNGGTIAVGNALAAFAASNAGTLNIGGDLSNAGIVNLASSTGKAGNVLNVAGNYTGTNGQVVLNTLLNQGGAASQSDRLVVGGNVSGTTAIKVNQSGSGAATVGDGIQLVQVGGTSAANSFHLAAPIQTGALQYLLFQGGATDANGWYLRSQFAQQTAADSGVPDSTTAPAATSAAATGPVAYRPAVAGYTVTPLLNADYGYAMLGRLHERVGDVASLDAAQPAHSNGVWGRIGGQNVDADTGDRFSADERTFFAEFGKDWTLSHNANGGSTHAGATVSFGSTSATFADSARSFAGLPDGTGSVETQAQSVGGYWTKYLPDGSYFDGVGQLTHYQNRYGDIFGDSGSQNGFGAGVSGEVGKPFALGSTGVAIEPQAQLLYQYLHLNHFDDGISDISSNTTNGLRGRIGFRIFKANLSNDSKTSALTPYFTADVLHDFFSPGQTTVGGTSFDNELGKTWYDLGIGMTGSFGKSSEGYANVKYAHNFSGEYRRTVFAQVGYRYSW